MNGRVYDPLIARFVSADPILNDPMNGQSYNRFAYVLNNPTNLTDPTGFLASSEVCASADGCSNWRGGLFGMFPFDAGNTKSKEKEPAADTKLPETKSEVSKGGNGNVDKSEETKKARDPKSLVSALLDTAKAAGNSALGMANTLMNLGDGYSHPYERVGHVETDGKLFVAELEKARFEYDTPVFGYAMEFLLPMAVGGVAERMSFKLPIPEIGAAERAQEIHSVLDPRAQRARTTAVTDTVEGIRVVSSSERRLSPAQRALLKTNEVEGVGVGHAEVTGINAAKNMGLTPTGTGASRPICTGCATALKEQNIEPLSPLK